MKTIVLPLIINSNVSAHHYYTRSPIKITIPNKILVLGPAYVKCIQYEDHYEAKQIVPWQI